uniref:Neural proliferation, differentiation and control, 1b n=1 Tax=Mola mola TaxID=94237 RepID=A0A3Q3W4U7_MOLML
IIVAPVHSTLLHSAVKLLPILATAFIFSKESPLCPRSLDCARAGRHFCKPGSSHCGRCLHALVENSHGRCVVRKSNRHLYSAALHSASDTFGEFSSGIMSSSDTYKLVHRSFLITLSLYFFSVMSSVLIIAGSLALVIAGASWLHVVELSLTVSCPFCLVLQPGDKKLAHSAQMYHYQHQKQQMLSLEKHRDESRVPNSGATTDEENEDGDFTVYECPGLAPTGEMEVKNPLFDDSTLYF